jgi:hypothetical protein
VPWQPQALDACQRDAQADLAGVPVARGLYSAAGMPPLWSWRRSLVAVRVEPPWQEDRAVAGPDDRELVAAAIVESAAAVAARQRRGAVLLERTKVPGRTRPGRQASIARSLR